VLFRSLLIQAGGKWKSFLRTAILMPSAMGLASASLLFWGLYSTDIGPINPILQAMHLTQNPIEFLGDPFSALVSTTFLIVWRFAGFYMLILLVGLQAIPRDLYEAAAIDGANRWHAFRYISLPLLRRSLALSLILCITGSLLAFDQFYILTKGGPDNSTITVVQLIYREAFQRLNLGTAAAISILVLAVLLILNAVQFRALRGAEDI
jgi:multiple sugar transport system permease protein